MIEVMQTLISWLTMLLNMFLADGGYIGLAVVCFPILALLVKAVRSLASKKN
ncbi:MAG: hypothetical protein HFH88_00130 [Lachnospiraceae bacterium]|nr:hypothetical protein [uncultured Acetatifactor sp.]MCI8798207.1 hypothetical protein [Lachnospiraceae bacterium]